MDMNQIKETDIWTLYDKSVSYCRMIGMYEDTDINHRMYNGDQWAGLRVKGVEKVQYNFIKPIVKYKTGVILSNRYVIVFSSENFENRAFRKQAEKICRLLNKKAAKIWEKDHMDIKLRKAIKDAAINDEGIVYVYYDEKKKMPVNEILDKNDIYFGNENSSDIQTQPYLILKQRKPVSEVREMARANGVDENEIDHIIGDLDNIEEAGEQAKLEKDNMCTVVTKLYKENGKVHFSQATKYVDIKKDTNTGLSYYQVAHVVWEEKKGSARGEGEVRNLIPNQIETNKTAMRRAISVKSTAYPTKVINEDKIQNPSAAERMGGLIKVKGGETVEDVNKVFATIYPAQMSSDVKALQDELIQSTRELAGAGDIVTGQVNPESASGRAILAVQQAAQQPLTENLDYTKGFVEDLALIWLDMLSTYSDSIDLEEEIKDPGSGETVVQIVKVLKDSLRELQAAVKIDITPKSAFDIYAQEQSLENLLIGGYFSQERMPETVRWAKLLEDNYSMPTQKIRELVEEYEKQMQKIAVIDSQAMLMQQNVERFLASEPKLQARQLTQAMQPAVEVS